MPKVCQLCIDIKKYIYMALWLLETNILLFQLPLKRNLQLTWNIFLDYFCNCLFKTLVALYLIFTEHFLCIILHNTFMCAQLCRLCNPTHCYLSLSTRCFHQEYWSALPFPPPGDLSNPRIKPMSLVSPALAGRFFTLVPPGKPYVTLAEIILPSAAGKA